MSARRNRRRSRAGRSLDEEKSVAKTFIEFLENESLKCDMAASELEKIYLSKFCLLFSTPDISFSRILNALTYHLNLCQRLQDRVIFGGGQTAALKLLSIEDTEADPGSFEEEPAKIGRRQHRCKICSRNFRSIAALENHLKTVSHRQQDILQTIRESVER